MIELSSMEDKKLAEMEEGFVASLKTTFDIFETDSFKKTLAIPGHRRVVNKPLFESVSVCLARISDKERSILLKRKDDFLEAFICLLEDQKFDIAISKSTANTEKVLTRFSMVSAVVNKLILGR